MKIRPRWIIAIPIIIATGIMMGRVLLALAGMAAILIAATWVVCALLLMVFGNKWPWEWSNKWDALSEAVDEFDDIFQDEY